MHNIQLSHHEFTVYLNHILYMKKIFVLLGIGVFSLGIISNVWAQENVSESNIIADVNLVNQGIVKQEGRNFTLGVNMQNKIGTQSGVLYGVQVYQTTAGERVLVDEFAVSDPLTIKKNEYMYREFLYSLPLIVSGKVELVAFLKTDKGILLSAAPIQEVEVAAVAVPVDVEDCTLDLDVKTLKCSLTNNTTDNQTIVLATQVKQGNSVFAPVAQALVPKEIVLNANETKEIVQNIDELVFLKDAFFETTITDQATSLLISRTTNQYEGPVGARIVNNVLINQTSAENYDIQIVSLYSGAPVQAKVTISDINGVCASKDVTIDKTVTLANFVLEKVCDTVRISVSSFSENGEVVDIFETEHQTLFPQAKNTEGEGRDKMQSNTELAIVIVLALLALLSGYVVIRNKQNKVNIKA